eukprot:CAMPEP_0197730302 /NCGR_PEP_ID=MMETSP1434-20131217/34004_1 /TAXON_ID=265543 /ORGANISM="Minutocellus polymorphus, Strain CCMP3303" /LENGTH=37 /DNA_ID= /DNA_START= /DNA_END= /DNA_ORIENTATION=
MRVALSSSFSPVAVLAAMVAAVAALCSVPTSAELTSA